jgi:hypothetical protein
MSKLTEADKRERRTARRLQTRVRWAHDLLVQAGFVDWSESHAHGFSRYYIRDGKEGDDEEAVRIRVSDHYAHPDRYWDSGDHSVDAGSVDVDPTATRRQIEKATRQAIQDHAEYLRADDFQDLCKERAEFRESMAGIPPTSGETMKATNAILGDRRAARAARSQLASPHEQCIAFIPPWEPGEGAFAGVHHFASGSMVANVVTFPSAASLRTRGAQCVALSVLEYSST